MIGQSLTSVLHEVRRVVERSRMEIAGRNLEPANVATRWAEKRTT